MINLENGRKTAIAAGALDQVSNIDADIVSTTASINQIKMALGLQ
jgi:hypothetical protein